MEGNSFIVNGKATEAPVFRTEKAAEAWEALASLTREERKDLFENAGFALERLMTEDYAEKNIDRFTELDLSEEDRNAFIHLVTDALASEGPGPKKIARASMHATSSMTGAIEGPMDIAAMMERFGLWKKDTIIITGFDEKHSLVYIGKVKYDPSVLSFRLKSIKETYSDMISSMIFVMNDPDLLEDMNRKLAKGLMRRLTLALKSVGYDTADILCSDGKRILSLRQFIRES